MLAYNHGKSGYCRSNRNTNGYFLQRYSTLQKSLLLVSFFLLIFLCCLKIFVSKNVFSSFLGLPSSVINNVILDAFLYLFVLFLMGYLLFPRMNNLKDSSTITIYEKVTISIYFITTFSYLAAFLYYPSFISFLDKEDGIIEWLSFLILISGSVAFILIAKGCQSNFHSLKLLCLILILASLLCFVMAMEEISWFQRVIGMRTPELFHNNIQNETNIHNFGSPGPKGLMMSGYFTVYFLCFVLIPALGLLYPAIFYNKFIKLFIPESYIIIFGAIPFAFHGILWNYPIFYRIFLVVSFGIILLFLFSGQKSIPKIYLLFASAIILMAQGCFLIFGSILDKNDILVYEFNELLTQSTILLYAFEVNRKMKSFEFLSKN